MQQGLKKIERSLVLNPVVAANDEVPHRDVLGVEPGESIPDPKRAFLRSGPEASRVQRVLQMTRWAAEEIELAKYRHPCAAYKLDAAWPYLGWDEGLLQNPPEALYRHHTRELLRRFARDGNLREGTQAEVLARLNRSSVEVGLDAVSIALANRLYRTIVGDRAVLPANSIPVEDRAVEERQEHVASTVSRERDARRH